MKPRWASRGYRFLRNQGFLRWRLLWASAVGKGRFGRFAARMMGFGSDPYHGREFLAELHPKGWLAPSASISHPLLEIGANVLVGDRVVISRAEGGGPVVLRDRVRLYGDSFLRTGSDGRIVIGEDTHIQPGCYLHSYLSEIVIGDKVEIAPCCAFYSYDHGMETGTPIMDQPLTSRGSIHIGDGAWLGHGVKVMSNVRIGDGAVVGAGAVVTRDIPANAIAAGAPAKVIRFRTDPAGQSGKTSACEPYNLKMS